MRIIFMGTPAFAVHCLDAILQAGYLVVGVVTAPDKPAGRGRKIQFSEVKQYALEHNLPLLQPLNLKDPDFQQQLEALKPDVQVVVAFRMLPQSVWGLAPTFNLHASLLPQYRGAAPINHAIINGERESGVTTFLLDKEIDTGKILLQEKVSMDTNETAGTLHDKLMVLGAKTILKTLELIRTNKAEPLEQQNLVSADTPLKPAPKIFKEDCRINWQQPTQTILNLIRGLSPMPGAFTEIDLLEQETFYMKIYEATGQLLAHPHPPGTLFTDNKQIIHITTLDGLVEVENMQAAGKKRMNTADFLRGFHFPEKKSLY